MFRFGKKWKLVGEGKKIFTYGGGIFNLPERDVNVTIAFYEKPSGKRKVEILGVDSYDAKQVRKLIEPQIYKWRDHKACLPENVVSA